MTNVAFTNTISIYKYCHSVLLTRLEKLVGDKHSLVTKYREAQAKKFYNIGPWCLKKRSKGLAGFSGAAGYDATGIGGG
jgi:hypothetical protein